MKLTEMKQVLSAENLQLTKSLGQNFLHDANHLRRIVESADLKKTDRVLEIGPGLGPVTELLLHSAGEILAIEKDKRLFEFVQRRFAGQPHFRALHDDALDYLKREPRDFSGWKLVSNLPYSVASPILVELAQARGCPDRMVATLQLEVVNRIVAEADGDDYGVLTLLLQLRYRSLGSFKIPADCFFPVPDVDSACVILEKRTEPLLPFELHHRFDRLVKLALSQRRKMMFKLLKQEFAVEKLNECYEKLGLSLQIRGEKVTLEQFAELTRMLCGSAKV